MFGWLTGLFGWFGGVQKKNMVGSGGLISVLATTALTHYLGLDPITAATVIGSVAGLFATWLNAHKEIKDVLGSTDQIKKIKQDIMLATRNADAESQYVIWRKTLDDTKPLVAPLVQSVGADLNRFAPSLAAYLPNNLQEQMNWLRSAGFDHFPMNKPDLDAMLMSILQKKMAEQAAALSKGVQPVSVPQPEAASTQLPAV